MSSYNYSEDIWEYVLPDGTPFCHLGGRNISYKILDHLNLRKDDRLCDICCGEGGTFTLINRESIEAYGVDISEIALEKARKKFEGRDIFHFIHSDVRNMPFKNSFFSKSFAQDPDVFLSPEKDNIINEISRVTRKRGIFVLQIYCTTSHLDKGEREKTEELLLRIGYPHTEVLSINKIDSMLKKQGLILYILRVYTTFMNKTIWS